jgi:hypothetical protein
MAIYTVHVPNGQALLTAADDTRFVPEAFSRRAFVFGPLWLLWNSLWIEAAIVFALDFAWYFAVHQIGWPNNAFWIGVLLLHCLLGLEGRSLLRAALGRRDYALTDVVMGDDLAAAEAQFFARWEKDHYPISAPTAHATGSSGPKGNSDVLGSMPHAGDRR